MEEHLSGISVTNGAIAFSFCFSLSVFTLGFEIYEGAFLLRLGPFVVITQWGLDDFY